MFLSLRPNSRIFYVQLLPNGLGQLRFCGTASCTAGQQQAILCYAVPLSSNGYMVIGVATGSYVPFGNEQGISFWSMGFELH